MTKSLYPQFVNLNLDMEAIDKTENIQNLDTIESLNKSHGLNIDHKTAVSKWQGDQLDIHLAVELLFNRDNIPNHENLGKDHR